MDTGNIRHWPRMTYAQLSKVFPDGRTVHVAADGRPLPGFALALAEVERRGQAPNKLSLEQALAHGAISAPQEQTAEAVARRQKRMLVARIFGRRDADETADKADAAAPSETSKSGRVTVASADATPVPAQGIVPLPSARPRAAATIAAAKSAPKPAGAPYVMASIGANMFDARGLWEVAPKPLAGLSKTKMEPKPLELASADPAVTGATAEQALAYAAVAPEAASTRSPRAKAMGIAVTRAMTGEAPPAVRGATLAGPLGAISGSVSGAFAHMASGGAQRLDSPWLRAAMLTPSVSHALTATRLGDLDPRGFERFLHKPARAVAMSFSADPWAGMRADRFSGRAVTFVEVATFVRPQTASLD
jgi:hypothetical protein